MFGKSKKLLERISQLEKELETEKLERAKVEASLAEFLTQKTMNARVFEEMRSAMETRLNDLDNRAVNFESFKASEIQKLEEEKRQTRESMKQQELLEREHLQQELEQNKTEQLKQIEQKLECYNESMNCYMAMLQDVIGVLTTAAAKAGRDIFSDNSESLSECFQRELENLRPYSLEGKGQTGLPAIKDAEIDRLLELYTKPAKDEEVKRDAP